MNTFYIITGNKIDRNKIFEALELDRLSYGDVYQLKLETCLGYFEKNNDIYIMAIDKVSKKVIGYINYSPINNSTFNKLISGSFIDTIITENDVLPYIDNKFYNGYFSSIVVHPDFRHRGVATQMLECWSKLVRNLAERRNIYFKEIVADAVTDAGVQLLTKIGFSLTKNSTHDSKIMTLNLFSKDTIKTSFNSKILEVYERYESGGMCG